MHAAWMEGTTVASVCKYPSSMSCILVRASPRVPHPKLSFLFFFDKNRNQVAILIIGLQGPGLIGAIGETTKGSQRRQIKCTSVWYRILSLNMHVLSIQKLL